MRFYNHQHRHYCGIDLHVKTMYVCILDSAGQVLCSDGKMLANAEHRMSREKC